MAEQRAGKAELGTFRIEDDENPDRAAVEWIQEQFQQEVARVKATGQMVIPVPVKNCSVVKEGKAFVNRVECATAFDFSKVKQILLSEPVGCPYKAGESSHRAPALSLTAPAAGYQYCNVVLVTRKPIPLLLPYMFEASAKNDRKHWIFVNAKLQRARHKVGTFASV